MSAIPLLVCDDSNMARKQLIRALPANWPFRITQATNGLEGLEAIRQGNGQIVLLDLTMPELDGFGVLTQLREEGLSPEVIVVSGDVQEEAVRRAKALGARAFLKKPADPMQLAEALNSLGVDVPLAPAPATQDDIYRPLPNVSFRDAFREISNVAMGRAADLLGRVLGVFIKLPIPNVNILEVGELHMALADAQRDERLSAICQGYIGGGIAGEALLIFHDSEIDDVAKLLNTQRDEGAQLEMQLDLASIIIGACLNGLSEQLNITLSQGHPLVLGQHCPIEDLIRINQRRWKRTLAVEISYGLENLDIHFDLLLLFTEDSVPKLRERLDYLID
ncbi:MAG TPA: response regulator [Pseudomonas sp.]|nr:response regulator [Pseudomonadales bacterium]MAQ51368.1 response regulator [Pseudomonas sp.]MEE3158908.1 response regulator [Pseudomonadota bacterium]HIQ52699.1 response regulator [Halopseudomonas pachastrellae]MBF77752.1 response regulator [Pseudomonadales bacterium]